MSATCNQWKCMNRITIEDLRTESGFEVYNNGGVCVECGYEFCDIHLDEKGKCSNCEEDADKMVALV